MPTKEISRTDYKTFKDFYPFYLQEHSNRTNRRLHVIGTLSAILTLTFILITGQYKFLWLPMIIGYGFAWVSILLNMDSILLVPNCSNFFLLRLVISFSKKTNQQLSNTHCLV